MVILRDKGWAMYHKPEQAMHYVIYHSHTDNNGTHWTGTLVDGNGDMLRRSERDDRQVAKYCMYCKEEAPAWMLGFQRLCKWSMT